MKHKYGTPKEFLSYQTKQSGSFFHKCIHYYKSLLKQYASIRIRDRKSIDIWTDHEFEGILIFSVFHLYLQQVFSSQLRSKVNELLNSQRNGWHIQLMHQVWGSWMSGYFSRLPPPIEGKNYFLFWLHSNKGPFDTKSAYLQVIQPEFLISSHLRGGRFGSSKYMKDVMCLFRQLWLIVFLPKAISTSVYHLFLIYLFVFIILMLKL